MALHVPKAPGVAQMLKDGARMYSGLEEAVFRNVSACKQFAASVRSAYGPNGMNKMIINHIDKQFVTSDAGTIVRELDVEHPAARLMVLASQMQDAEVGDGTNFVIVLCGALLEAAEELLRLGIGTEDIARGYERALAECLEALPTLACRKLDDYRDGAGIELGVSSAIASKQYGNERFLARLVASACASVLPENATFNVDNVRVCKILGGGLLQSSVIQGMVFKRQIEGDVGAVKNAKVALYSCPVDITQTETKGTVLIKSAEELLSFSRGEESLLETQIKAIADTGAKVIVSGGKFGDMALHFVNKYELMAVRLNSKFDLRRLAKTVGGTVLPRLTPPTAQELGFIDDVNVEEFGDTSTVVFRSNNKDSRISTILIRGATDNYMDDIERALDDGVNTFKGIARDGRFLPGAGAVELELSHQLIKYADSLPGLDQYAVRKFATALETFPKILAENSGANSTNVLANLHRIHQEGNKFAGYDIESECDGYCDANEKNILDLYISKEWGLKYAVEAACTIIKIDQIIMAKRAGGPKPRAGKKDSDDES